MERNGEGKRRGRKGIGPVGIVKEGFRFGEVDSENKSKWGGKEEFQVKGCMAKKPTQVISVVFVM